MKLVFALTIVKIPRKRSNSAANNPEMVRKRTVVSSLSVEKRVTYRLFIVSEFIQYKRQHEHGWGKGRIRHEVPEDL